MKRNSKYLVCKWGSGKRNDSAAKYILWILSCESQKIWVGSLFSVRIPTAVHGMMDCGCKYHCGQSGKEERWTLPIGMEQIQWVRHSIYTMSWASAFPAIKGNLLLPPRTAEQALFCLLFAIYWSTRNWITLTSVLMQGKREDSPFSSSLLHRSNDILAPGCWPGLIKPWISTARFDSKFLLLKKISGKG